MEQIQRIAYAKYQLVWMLRHGYSLQDLLHELYEYQYDDPEDSDRISSPVTEIFDGWEEESGFHGELWVCFDEFLGAEYQDAEYMKLLLTSSEYVAYKEDAARTNVITKGLIADGIRANLVRFVVDPNMESGTVCQIGDSWFYFGGLTAEETSPEEYLANVPPEDIVDEIFDVLEEFRKDEEFADEYDYYWNILSYRNDM